MSKYPNELLNLMNYFKKFPSVGSRTAERFVFQLLTWSPEDLKNFSLLISSLKNQVQFCAACGCFMSSASCEFCDSTKRDFQLMCIISSPKDAYAIEQTRTYKGLYHVMSGKTFEPKEFEKLKARLQQSKVQEVVLALDSTLEGDMAALHLKEHLSKENIKVSRLASGLPLGSSLDYIDGGTLARAFSGRQSF